MLCKNNNFLIIMFTWTLLRKAQWCRNVGWCPLNCWEITHGVCDFHYFDSLFTVSQPLHTNYYSGCVQAHVFVIYMDTSEIRYLMALWKCRKSPSKTNVLPRSTFYFWEGYLILSSNIRSLYAKTTSTFSCSEHTLLVLKREAGSAAASTCTD